MNVIHPNELELVIRFQAALAVIERVRELHEPRDDNYEACSLCTELIQGEGLFVRYPCPTIQALEGDTDE